MTYHEHFRDALPSTTHHLETFSGPLTIYNSPCFGYEFTTGTISGSAIEFGIINNSIIFEASAKGSKISGVYYVYSSPSGYCTGDSGTLVLRRY